MKAQEHQYITKDNIIRRKAIIILSFLQYTAEAQSICDTIMQRRRAAKTRDMCQLCNFQNFFCTATVLGFSTSVFFPLKEIYQINIKMSLVGALLFCNDCGGLLERCPASQANIDCDVCGKRNKSECIFFNYRIFKRRQGEGIKTEKICWIRFDLRAGK